MLKKGGNKGHEGLEKRGRKSIKSEKERCAATLYIIIPVAGCSPAFAPGPQDPGLIYNHIQYKR